MHKQIQIQIQKFFFANFQLKPDRSLKRAILKSSVFTGLLSRSNHSHCDDDGDINDVDDDDDDVIVMMELLSRPVGEPPYLWITLLCLLHHHFHHCRYHHYCYHCNHVRYQMCAISLFHKQKYRSVSLTEI